MPERKLMSYQQAVDRAQAALDAWDEAHQIGPTDPGLQSMRFHETQAQSTKRVSGYLNQLRREDQERTRLVKALEDAKRAHRISELPTEPVDPTTLNTATHILVRERYRAVWYRVKRVNKTTVTCHTEPGYDEPRIPHNKIVGTRND